LSYNALDINGSIIGFFTSDSQFVIFDPSSGVTYAGHPIGDKLRQNNGQAGTNWNPANVYVAWYVSGEDQAWYIADGKFGWYRLCSTPSPEVGMTWSPFASIVNGTKAVVSVETTPGVHKLLLGPTATGPILARNLSVFTDNTSAYNAFANTGSIVLAQPGQIACVMYITTDTVLTGTPISVSVIVDEAFPFFTGPFELLKNWTDDPPELRTSTSIRGQRFYLSELQNYGAECRHMQVKTNFGLDTVQNELLSFTVWGTYKQES